MFTAITQRKDSLHFACTVKMRISAQITQLRQKLSQKWKVHICGTKHCRNRYLPRECDTCKHWVIGDETPMKCEVGGCEDLKKRENWEWGYKCRSDTLFSRVSRSPEDMAEFLLDKVILSPCEVICGGECSAIGNLEQIAMDQCKKKIIDFLNQDINNIENERN